MEEKRFLCSNCFKNFGLRKLVENIAKNEEKIKCNNCNSIGLKINKSKAYELMDTFFVYGSVPPEYGVLAPIYHFNKFHYPGKILFGTELDSDIKLLSDYLHMGIFEYGPPMWRVGVTDYYDKLVIEKVHGKERRDIWTDIIKRCNIEIFNTNCEIFRIRNSRERMPPASPEEFDTPPKEYTIERRFNTKDFPIFYGALDIETCLFETRATLGDYSMLAVFKPEQELRILNIADNINDNNANTPFESVEILLESLDHGGKNKYSLCREMAMEIRREGYDGFLSHSYFNQAHKKNLYDINLFGYPAHENKIKLVSTNRVKLTSMSYKYQFGPTNNTFYPPDPEKLTKMINKELLKLANPTYKAGHLEQKDTWLRLMNYLNRKSETPI